MLLAIPLRGTDSGQWDLPLNGNAGAIDTLEGGQATLALSAATTLTLSMPATGTVSASANSVQSWNAAFKLSGTLTGGNSTIALTMPRRYIIDATGLTAGTSCVVLAPASGTGTRCGVPWGEVTEFWFDGTNVNYMNFGRVGELVDLAVSTTPSWITQSTKQPLLLCDGSIYSSSIYPTLGTQLGSTWAGNGITTFGTPDLRSRLRLMQDAGGSAGRVTTAGSGIDGSTVGASGGSQLMQQHAHTGTIGGSQSLGNIAFGPNQVGSPSGGDSTRNSPSSFSSVTVNGSNFTLAVSSTGLGSSQNMPPSAVFGLTYIRAG